MPLPETDLKQLTDHLIRLGIGVGDSVVVHSKLASFGRLVPDLSVVHQALRDVIGRRGAIAVPTYTFSLGDEVFDPLTTPSHQVGVFSEYVRTLPGARRSLCPIHSHAWVGGGDEILNSSGTTSVGRGSDFELLEKMDFKLLLLGCRFSEGATYLHHLEALVGVPYRQWTQVPRRVVIGNEVHERQISYYSRVEGSPYTEDFDAVLAESTVAEVVKSDKCPLGQSYATGLRALHERVVPRLESDPYFLVRKIAGP